MRSSAFLVRHANTQKQTSEKLLCFRRLSASIIMRAKVACTLTRQLSRANRQSSSRLVLTMLATSGIRGPARRPCFRDASCTLRASMLAANLRTSPQLVFLKHRRTGAREPYQTSLSIHFRASIPRRTLCRGFRLCFRIPVRRKTAQADSYGSY